MVDIHIGSVMRRRLDATIARSSRESSAACSPAGRSRGMSRTRSFGFVIARRSGPSLVPVIIERFAH